MFDALESTREGLREAEAARRLDVYGPNRVPEAKKTGPLARFAMQFHNLLIYVLIVAALMTAALQHWVDTAVIVGVVVVNAVIGFIQEGKAERALDAIRNMLSHQAFVRRGGRSEQIDAAELVPGDVVALQAGDKVPADVRLFQVKDLRVDESILTGESVPVGKGTEPVDPRAVIGDRTCMAYSGTLVTYGRGSAVVVATGAQSEIGRISAMLGRVQTLTTPLMRQIARFSQWLSGGILITAVATFLFGTLLRDYSAADMFLAAVGLAVAAIPEGLPAIMTITLAVGVQRMAQRKAIIRRLPAVETLGALTVICSDKTGTLTKNEMTAQAVVTAGGSFEVTGAGYDPHGAFRTNGTEVAASDYPVLYELCRAAILCNDAAVSEREGQWRLQGDPTEGALVVLGMKAGLDPSFQQDEWPRTDVIPFESEHRFMATLHHDRVGHAFIYLKGAPERVLDMCTYQRMRGEDVPLDRVYWEAALEELAGRGQRPLAIGFKQVRTEHSVLAFENVHDELTLLGVVGMMDPPREEAIAAVRECQSAGIRVKMITGDHAATARAIGRRMGIGDGRTAVGGAELEARSDDELKRTAVSSDIFARTSPEHKLRLVRALQANGDVVGMTGDGVNDAPALKRADVGIAMGVKGTDVATEAAEMVLADDNFASIAHAVEEGRTVYDNLKKAIMFVLPTNGGEALTIIGAIALGRALPITPVQILWVNMITAVTLALALAFEMPEKGVMKRSPRFSDEPILSKLLLWRIGFVSVILVTGTFGMFLWLRAQGAEVELARTAAVNTLVMYEIFYLFNSRFLVASALTRNGLLGNPYALIAVGVLVVFQLLFTYAPPLQILFGTRPLNPGLWAGIVLTAAVVFVLVEMEKYVLRRRARRYADSR